MTDEKMVTLPKSLYDQLVKDVRFLDLLLSAGVDNWEGWDTVQEMWKDED